MFFLPIKSPPDSLDTFDNAQLLEIGTFEGFSASQFARHAKRVITIEVDKASYEKAKVNLSEDENILCIFGNAKKIIPLLPQTFDVVFIDALKIEYHEYLRLILEKMNNGGVIFVDNTISHREKLDDFFSFLEQEGLMWEELGLGKGLIKITV